MKLPIDPARWPREAQETLAERAGIVQFDSGAEPLDRAEAGRIAEAMVRREWRGRDER